ncbi:TPA: chloramphenicol resistance leader peptide [Pseudomonas aeruginosa]
MSGVPGALAVVTRRALLQKS